MRSRKNRRKPSIDERIKEGLIAAFFGAAVGVFSWVLGIPMLISFWGGVGTVVFLYTFVFGLLGVLLGPGRGRALAVLSLLAVEILYGVVAVSPLTARLTKGMPRDDLSPEHADAVFVFGSSVYKNGEMSDVALARLVHGLEVLSAGQAPRIVLSELRSPHAKYGPPAAKLMSRLGIKRELLTVGPVVNSHDEAVLVGKLSREKGWKSIVAVTSPLHSRRACAALEHQGLKVICSPSIESHYDLESLSHAQDRLLAFGAAMHERLGAWVYKRRGWIAE